MNKKLLAAAIAAAFVAPTVASAEATIYGSLHTSIDRSDIKNSSGQQVVDNWDVVGNDGQLGIKGSEDLGGSLKALYKIEMNLDPSGGDLGSQCADGINSSRCTSVNGSTSTMTWDEVWIGLTGGWGTALIGREDTPYKTFMDSPGVDILGDSIIDVDTQLKTVGANGFERFTANGAIAYVSPNFSGFTFGAAVIPGGQNPVPAGSPTNFDGLAIKDGFADHYSIAGNYVGGGLKVALGYEKKVPVSGVGGTPATRDDQKNSQIGASYTFGSFFVGAKYEQEDNVNWEKDVDAKRWAISGKYSFGNNAVGLVYGQDKEEVKGAPDRVEARGWGIMGEHNFSNRTKVYVAYGDSEDKATGSKAEAKQFATGLIHSF